MRRFLGILAIGAAIVLAVGYFARLKERRTSAGVAALLPRNTVALVHLPDFNGTIEEWHHCDIYQIYREPAVQEFLKKPMSRSPKSDSASARIHQLQELVARDAFIALTSVTDDKPKFVAGFHFHCSQEEADRVIADWQAQMNPSAKHDRETYQKHDIDVFRQSTFSIAMVKDQNWFFASNDFDELKAVLDRADGRIKDRETLLTADESYRDAISAMPGSYALLFYFQPKTLVERLAAARKAVGRATPLQFTSLEQIRCVCGSTRFDHGKMRDVVFTGMPKQETASQLNRGGLALTTPATIFYAASLVEFSRQIGTLFPPGENNALGPAAQRISAALATAGIAPADWDAAFASEFSMISDWPEQMRLPSLLVSTAVKDPVRARKIIDTLIRASSGNGQWAETDRDGVHYWSMMSSAGWFAVRPVMALSDRLWITGLDSNSVEMAIRRAQKPEPGLENTDNYRSVIRLVPAPEKFFTYVDPAQIYLRIDASVRPFLMMGAAFLPAANDFADLSKLPPPEAITRHLSPIVSSQYYSGKGYVAESVGPVTLNQAVFGVAAMGGAGAIAYQRFLPHGLNQFGAPKPSTGNAGAPMPSPTATPSPKQTP